MPIKSWKIYNSKERHFFITGAAGYLGGKLLKRLASNPNYQITAIARKPVTAIFSNVKYEICDISNVSKLTEVLAKVSEPSPITDVIHLASPNPAKASLQELIDTNVMALDSIIKMFSKEMIARQKGHILVMGSLYGIEPPGAQELMNYSMAKAALRIFTLQQSKLLQNFGVQITHFAPGPIDSPLNKMSGLENLLNPDAIVDAVLETLLSYKKQNDEVIIGSNRTNLAANEIDDSRLIKGNTNSPQSQAASSTAASKGGSTTDLIKLFRNLFPSTGSSSDKEINGLKFGDTPDWDSLGQLRLIAASEEQFGKKIATQQIRDLNSFNAFAKFLELRG